MGGAAAITTLFGPAAAQAVRSAAQHTSSLTPGEAARDETFWREIQQAFSVPRGIVNLDNGCTCPAPRMVMEAMVRYSWQQEEAPCHTSEEILWPMVQTVRTDLARLFGCEAEELAIVRNTTEALDIVLLGVELKRGDEIITTTQDYWAMLDALNQRVRRDGITVKLIKVPTPPASMHELTSAFERAITSKTRLLLVSHPVNLTGQFFPVRDICRLAHQKGVEVVVDGAHSFAHTDFKVADLECDYYGTSLHKWLLGPIGTGLLYVRKDKIGKVWPLFPCPDKRRENISKFHFYGTAPPAPHLAVGEALAFHNSIGSKRKEERLRYLTNYWVSQIRDRPNVRFHTSFAPGMSCGLATFEIVGVDPDAVTKFLWKEHRILVQSIVHEEFKGVRVSPNVYSTLNELDKFCEIVELVAQRGLPKSG
ncbi:MAG: aminotransferase class V-fold PLP-dependent enzyme [Gemmatimonadaceae bacterium]